MPGRDGKTIFAGGTTYRGELSRLDTRSGQFQPFLGGISAQGVTFSRDGKTLAYVSYPEGIFWKADPDGSRAIQLTSPPLEPYLPSWSPDGSQMEFVDMPSSSIYLVSTAGGRPRRLLPESKDQVDDASWSADGRKIVFSTLVTTGLWEVVRVVDLATKQVTTVPGSEGMQSPRWSPDGRSILALLFRTRGMKLFDVGTQQWRWVVPQGQQNLGFPTWSKDSQFIYYIRFNGAGKDKGLYRVRARGGEPERVADLSSLHLGGWFYAWMGLDAGDAPLVVRDLGGDDIYALTLEQK